MQTVSLLAVVLAPGAGCPKPDALVLASECTCAPQRRVHEDGSIMSAVFQPIPPRTPPIKQAGFVHWVRTNLFADWKSALTTVVMIALALYFLPRLADWAIFQAVFQPNAEVCQQARGTGACWGVIAEKYRLIIFGRYPYADQWRPEIATGLLVGLLMLSCIRRFWKPWLPLVWVAVLAAFFALMYGGVAGLSVVTTDRWGGLPLTIMLATLSIVLAFPIRCWSRSVVARSCLRSARSASFMSSSSAACR